VLLGKIQPNYFPTVFGPAGDAPIDGQVVREKFESLVQAVAAQTGQRYSTAAAAEGFIAIAVANMANAIKRISIARGHDVTQYVLNCFGGAAGQHACLVADALAMDVVMLHPLAGVLSAYGIGLAEQRVVRERTLSTTFDPLQMRDLDAEIAELKAAAAADLQAQVPVGTRIAVEARVLLRYADAESLIDVVPAAYEPMRFAFEARHLAQFGFLGTGAIVAESIRVEAATQRASGAEASTHAVAERATPNAVEHVTAHMAGRDWQTPVFRRADLDATFLQPGPALIVDDLSTTVVEPGWQASVDRCGVLLLRRYAPRAATTAILADVDPVRLEVFNGLFMSIAEDMGAALRQTAASVNIRERLDFSCAVFDAAGNLVANAPHMPVHLGSMGESVRTILGRRAANLDGRGIRAGDVYALNAPYNGGTHLPDITVVMPVFVPSDSTAPAFFVAARGHHADVGGITPGSMPPNSKNLGEEGVLFDNSLIVEDGRFLESDVLAVLTSGPWPARNPAQNVADLKAQVAACAKGALELHRACAHYGATMVSRYMAHVQANAEEAVRRVISRLRSGSFRYDMDDGACVVVSIAVDATARTARVDFTGTSAQHAGNFNAPVSVVRAAVLYVVRTLLDDPIPMNEGCLRPITVVVPSGSMLNPRFPAAVVAGNVETSQVITDALFGALGVMAAAQGTMNNFTFGNERYQYYETIAGGSGAGPDFDGADVVQTHMTNSRLTDPEVLESRFPVVLEEFAIRHGSGGRGACSGGDGAVRRVRFLEQMQASILANRRRVPPFGLAGGEPGALGRHWIERADGSREALDATASVDVAPGDVFVIETPGGGGFGVIR
jgi:5-oxoprolinase (ATP-hydrolysing)